MASFSAELRVAGVVIPLIRCTYGTYQSTDARGRVITKVRKSPIDCEADVPEHQVLDAWAADAHKRQEATIIFFNADMGTAWETLHLKAAYCTSYVERFVHGDVSSGSYRCFFALSDPDGWTWYPGGLPEEAAIRPPAREHGVPPAVGASAAAALADAQKLPIIPLADNIPPATWIGSQDLPGWTEAHKAARWAEYQRDKVNNPKAYSQKRWNKSYETTRNNNIFGLGREHEYAAAMGAVSKVIKTQYTLRQIDMYAESEDNLYCGQLKTGYIYHTSQARTDLKRDKWLVDNQYQVEYILEKGASKPMLAAIEAIGATYKIGPQIP